MHLNPYGEYAVLLAASLANDWPDDRNGIVERAREFGMTMTFPTAPEDHARTRQVIDDWLAVVDADDPATGPTCSTRRWPPSPPTPG